MKIHKLLLILILIIFACFNRINYFNGQTTIGKSYSNLHFNNLHQNKKSTDLKIHTENFVSTTSKKLARNYGIKNIFLCRFSDLYNQNIFNTSSTKKGITTRAFKVNPFKTLIVTNYKLYIIDVFELSEAHFVYFSKIS
ncbi:MULTISPECIES: hypothetical protein [unclassified Apibacter]|uniref:hypothetical protein n=1 Tax=unclassified Apibacter TaxID=2630820 RepID=UPI001328429B|nr:MULTISPECIES: hypothetical protein [unclassified Apibacter]MCX8676374.1 hypothetical protein [Apibacter sp. B3919]MXO23838.1 hypothetical protein [Apibacter sp. B3924]MXO26484.1 hypothetical protein [Apibacter sp. B3813]MXO28436.1 hypothetical protein [Apibacter sp. B3913]MXO30390.1 hypothetical protein [Apibacter sp. B3912]